MKLIGEVKSINESKTNPKPILLKIAPDLNSNQLDEIITIVRKTNIDGVIATNTSITRTNLKTSIEQINNVGNGGLSGQPINKSTTEVIRYLSEKSNRAFPIIGVGGIHSAEDAIEKLEAGADLVQIYTGFIYVGPGLIKTINKKIVAHYG